MELDSQVLTAMADQKYRMSMRGRDARQKYRVSMRGRDARQKSKSTRENGAISMA